MIAAISNLWLNYTKKRYGKMYRKRKSLRSISLKIACAREIKYALIQEIDLLHLFSKDFFRFLRFPVIQNRATRKIKNIAR